MIQVEMESYTYAKAIEAGVDIVDVAIKLNGRYDFTAKCKLTYTMH